MKHYLENRVAAVILLSPGILLFLVAAVWPLTELFWYSTVRWNGWAVTQPEFVGLKNYVGLLGREDVRQSVVNVLWFTALSTLTHIPIGYAFGIYVASHPPGYRLIKMFLFIPLVLSLTAVGLMWYFILMPQGLLNGALRAIGASGVARNWLVDTGTALAAVIFVNTWISIGFYMILSYGATRAIPQSVLDAATIDGATGMERFRSIVLPLIWQTFRVSLVFVVTGSIRVFDLIFVLTDGGPLGTTEVPLTLVYRYAFSYQRYGEGSAIAVLVFVASVAVAIGIMRLSNRGTVEV